VTYQQSVFKHYTADKYFSEFLHTRWRQKSTGEYGTKLRHCHPMYFRKIRPQTTASPVQTRTYIGCVEKLARLLNFVRKSAPGSPGGDREKIFAMYITKQQINIKNSTTAGYQERNYTPSMLATFNT